MLAALRQASPGVLAAWLTKQDDGSWLDVILWRSRDEADEAARRIDQIPEAKRWFQHIAESKGQRHVEVAHAELFELGASSPDLGWLGEGDGVDGCRVPRTCS